MKEYTNIQAVEVTDAAKRLCIHPQTAYRWAKSGRIKSVKIGTRVLIPLATIEELLTVKAK